MYVFLFSWEIEVHLLNSAPDKGILLSTQSANDSARANFPLWGILIVALNNSGQFCHLTWTGVEENKLCL